MRFHEESQAGVGCFAAVEGDGLLERGGAAVVEVGGRIADAPERRGSPFLWGRRDWFWLGVLGSLSVLTGKFIIDNELGMYVGIGLLVGASLWNIWPHRSRRPSLSIST